MEILERVHVKEKVCVGDKVYKHEEEYLVEVSIGGTGTEVLGDGD